MEAGIHRVRVRVLLEKTTTLGALVELAVENDDKLRALRKPALYLSSIDLNRDIPHALWLQRVRTTLCPLWKDPAMRSELSAGHSTAIQLQYLLTDLADRLTTDRAKTGGAK